MSSIIETAPSLESYEFPEEIKTVRKRSKRQIWIIFQTWSKKVSKKLPRQPKWPLTLLWLRSDNFRTIFERFGKIVEICVSGNFRTIRIYLRVSWASSELRCLYPSPLKVDPYCRSLWGVAALLSIAIAGPASCGSRFIINGARSGQEIGE